MSIQNKSVERILAGVGGGGQPLIETDAELRTITGEKPRDLAGRYMEFVRHYFSDISNQTACINNGIIYESEINIPSMQELFKNVVYAHNPDRLYYFNANHLGSGSLITDKYGQTYQTLIYAPHGEVLFNKFYGDYDEVYKFTGYEKDNESGLDYAHNRYHEVNIGFNSTDPMWWKYPWITSYNFAGNNPIMVIDPTGMIWKDVDGNKIEDHSNIKVYIFYDPKSFGGQSEQMYKDAEAKYGTGSVALSDVTTMSEFKQDWGDMASGNIKEVDLNYHGNNQTIMLNSSKNEYITATGDGKSNRSDKPSTNVQDLPKPKGNVADAQLNINSCKSNSKTQYPLKGSGQTLMEAFRKTTDFNVVRGTSDGVSYGRTTQQPFPGHSWWKGTWDYMYRPVPQRYPGKGLPPK